MNETPTAIAPAEGSAPVAASAPVAPAAVVATPAPVVAPAAEASPAAKPDVKSIMASLSPAERRRVASGNFDGIKIPGATPPEPVAAAPVVEAAPAAAIETPSTETPVTPAPVATESNAGGESPEQDETSDGTQTKRFRFSSEEDKAVAQIAKARGVSLVEASRIYAGNQPAGQVAPAAEAAPTVDPVVTEIDTKITELKERITKLQSDGKKAGEDLDGAAIVESTVALTDAKAELLFLEHEKKGILHNRVQEVQTSYQRGVDAARDRVFAEFPAFAKADSMERLALDAHVTRALNDPARKAEFQRDPSWPEKLAREFAGKHGIKPKSEAVGTAPVVTTPAAKPAVITKTQPVQVTTPAGARLLTSASGATPSAPKPLTVEEAREQIRKNPGLGRQVFAELSKRK